MLPLLDTRKTPNATVYVDDVFSAYTYTGNGATQTITNGIDLAGHGGMVWTKVRELNGGEENHRLYDTLRGAGNSIQSNSTAAQDNQGNSLTTFNSNGYTLGGLYLGTNGNNYKYASWTFRKAPKFFDVVTFTTSTSTNTNQRISHSLGHTPGMIIFKSINGVSSWPVWHRSLTDLISYYMTLNTPTAESNYGNCFGSSGPSVTDFGINTNFFGTNVSMVAYIFAHDTDTANGIIQCGSLSYSPSAVSVNLGWEPQYVLLKSSSTTSQWNIYDVSRGMPVTTSTSAGVALYANLPNAEVTSEYTVFPTATGFTVQGATGLGTMVYLAIRRPNKPPTTGTQVYNAIARTGTALAAAVTGVGFAPDAVFSQVRNSAGRYGNFDRLRGTLLGLRTASTGMESSYTSSLTSFDMDGYSVGTDGGDTINSPFNFVNWCFRRAPGVFDIVCYTGTGSATTITHNLGVVPELMIVKNRSVSQDWDVFHSSYGGVFHCYMTNAGTFSSYAGSWNSTNPTATVFSIGTSNAANTNNFIAYLFATKAGISKVFSYTGNGTNQTIDCGFAAGARFVLIKRTDSTGDWYIWDTVRGIVAGNDPHLSLNTTAAEVTTNDSIDPASAGFIVNQDAATNINVNGATYIGLAYA